MLPPVSMGERWGELYNAMQSSPSENMSEEVVRLLSTTKSGDV